MVRSRVDFPPPPCGIIPKRLFRSADGYIDQEIALNRRPAEMDVQLCFNRDCLQKLIAAIHSGALKKADPVLVHAVDELAHVVG